LESGCDRPKWMATLPSTGFSIRSCCNH